MKKHCKPITDKEIDTIYDFIDELCTRGKFDFLNCWFETLCEVSDYFGDDIFLTYLTASFPAKSKLPARAKLFKMIEKRMGKEILKGLD